MGGSYLVINKLPLSGDARCRVHALMRRAGEIAEP